MGPTNVQDGRFTDGSAHRQNLLAPYKTYSIRPRLTNDQEEDLRTAEGLLFGTGWGMV